MVPAWLTAAPVAHRGLHDASAGCIENTLPAIRAAMDHGFAIEVDLQLSADGEAMVHHDEHLGRLTEGSAALIDLTAAEIGAAKFKATGDHIPTLAELLATVAGKVPLVIELKTLNRPDKDQALVRRTAELLKAYAGPAAVMSFDPAIVAGLRRAAPDLTRGITADACTDDDEWAHVSRLGRIVLANILHAISTRPQFIAYHVNDLPRPAITLLRRLFGIKLLTWTVRTTDQRARANAHADQMIFEGFMP